MKISIRPILFAVCSILSINLFAQIDETDSSHRIRGYKQLFLDIHRFQPGKVKFEAVTDAHARDLAVQGKYGVEFKKYWVDEEKGLVYCLSLASDSASIRNTHAEAHGLLPDQVYQVTGGQEVPLKGRNQLFIDIHEIGPGQVSLDEVHAAHQKDLAVQKNHGVNFINYWVNEKAGIIICLSQAKDANSIIKTHVAAHGLVPTTVLKVKQGE